MITSGGIRCDPEQEARLQRENCFEARECWANGLAQSRCALGLSKQSPSRPSIVCVRAADDVQKPRNQRCHITLQIETQLRDILLAVSLVVLRFRKPTPRVKDGLRRLCRRNLLTGWDTHGRCRCVSNLTDSQTPAAALTP
jgi:hypothetical protein